MKPRACVLMIPTLLAFGTMVSHDALLYKNHFHAVRTPVVDRGRQTRQVDNVVRDDEEYTPERGPMR